MKIGILGTGDVGRSLGRAFATLGHDVHLGSRSADNEAAAAWADEVGAQASHGTFADAARFGELLVLAVAGRAIESALASVDGDACAGKLVLDATNPYDFQTGERLVEDSGGELAQRLLPDAHVVKCFNSVGHGLMFRPDLPGGPPDMFICGDDDSAKARTRELLGEFGWNAVDLGGIGMSRALEPLAVVWVAASMRLGRWDHAFKLIHR